MNVAKLHALARALREVALEASSDAGEDPVSASELAIVEDVARHTPTTIGEIAKRTSLAQSLVSRTVVSLCGAGLFSKARDPGDGRKSLVRLASAQSDMLRERGSRSIEEVLSVRLAEPGDAERQHVLALLEELAARFLPNK